MFLRSVILIQFFKCFSSFGLAFIWHFMWKLSICLFSCTDTSFKHLEPGAESKNWSVTFTVLLLWSVHTNTHKPKQTWFHSVWRQGWSPERPFPPVCRIFGCVLAATGSCVNLAPPGPECMGSWGRREPVQTPRAPLQHPEKPCNDRLTLTSGKMLWQSNCNKPHMTSAKVKLLGSMWYFMLWTDVDHLFFTWLVAYILLLFCFFISLIWL